MKETQKPRGRPPKNPGARAHKRTMAFDSDVYEALGQIAEVEQRDITAQVNKVLRDFVEQYSKQRRARVPA